MDEQLAAINGDAEKIAKEKADKEAADKEKADGHKLTVPLRGECKMDKFQLGFLGFIRPLFATATKITNVDMQDQIDGLDAIAKKWQDKAAAEAAGDAAEDADNVRR